MRPEIGGDIERELITDIEGADRVSELFAKWFDLAMQAARKVDEVPLFRRGAAFEDFLAAMVFTKAYADLAFASLGALVSRPPGTRETAIGMLPDDERAAFTQHVQACERDAEPTDTEDRRQ